MKPGRQLADQPAQLGVGQAAPLARLALPDQRGPAGLRPAQVAIQAFDDLDAPPAKVSGADVPMPYAANLERLTLPSTAQVIEAAKSVCYA